MYDYLIVGAGLFGAVFAERATAKGKTCLVVERRNHIGGNCYTERIEGINVHKYGAHIFRTSDKRIWDYFTSFCEFNHFINSPIANYYGKIFNLPFNMNTFSRIWNIGTPEEAERIIKRQSKEIIGDPNNLEEKAISLVGRDIYEILIKDYTEKQWGRPCTDLPASIIRRLPVRFTYDNNYYDDCYQGIPIGGYSQIFKKMFSGCEVLLNTDYSLQREKLNSLASNIIYSGAIDEFFDYCYGALQYRSLRFETETLYIPNFQGVAVMNYTDSDTPYTRIIEHKHFEFGQQKNTVISKEYPVEWRLGLEPYYPINDDKNNSIFEQYYNLSQKEERVHFGGRLGEYKYYDMQDTIKSSLSLAEKLLD